MTHSIRVVALAALLVISPYTGTAAAGVPTNSVQEAQTSTEVVAEGYVFAPDGDPVSGAEVSIPLAEKTLNATTDSSGAFTIYADGVTPPDRAVIVAKRPGFLPDSKLVQTGSGGTVRLDLGIGGQRSVSVGSGVYHLGDSDYSGTINSKFQTASIGDEHSWEFALNPVQTTADGATLKFMARGVQGDNRIYLNGQRIGSTTLSPDDGSATLQTVTVDPSLLEDGENTLRVESAETGWYSDLDDFEVSNMQLALDGVPRDRENPRVSLSVPSAVPIGSEKEILLEATDNNRVAIASITLRHDGEVVGTRSVEGNRLAISKRFEEPGTYSVTTQVTDQSGNVETSERSFQVSNVIVSAIFTDPTIPSPGAGTSVSAVVDSYENISGPVVAELSVDGESVATKEISGLEPGHNGVQWEGVELEPGTREIRVRLDPSGENSRLIGSPEATVTSDVPPVTVEKFYTEELTTEPGEAVMAAGTTHTVVEVKNPLDREVTASFDLRVDGEDVSSSRAVTIEPGDSQRLLFAWNSEYATAYDLNLSMDTETAGEYAFSESYQSPAEGSASKAVPSEMVRVDTNMNINFRLWGESLGGVSVTRDLETNEIQSVDVPYYAPEEYPISVTVRSVAGNEVIGEKETVASGRYGSVSVPVDVDDDTRYVKIVVSEQGSVRNFAGQLLMGYTGIGAVTGLQDIERAHFRDTPAEEYYNSMQYRGVVVAQLSGYPPTDEFIQLQQRVEKDELWKQDFNTAIEVLGVLVGGKAALSEAGSATSVADDVLTAHDFVSAADGSSDFDFENTDVSVDTSDTELATDVGRIDAAEFQSRPGYVSAPTDRTALQYMDVKTTGFVEGDAEVEVEYSQESVRSKSLKESSLELKYWDDGEWNEADGVHVDPENDEIRGDIPVTELDGTPIVIDGAEQGQVMRLVTGVQGLIGPSGGFLTSIGGVLVGLAALVAIRRLINKD